ncbi:MAG: HAD family hydrolase [Muribaculaceae bacterium]|nr:HAD family hydrolase [Muribaculaceae bacterium]
MKTLFVSDLDGTLLNNNSEISPCSRDILNSVIADGALFSIATARTPATIADITRGVNLNLPLVVMTGVALWNRDKNQYSNIHYIDPTAVDEMMAIYRNCNVPTFLYTLEDNMIIIYHQGEMTPEARLFMDQRINSPYKRFVVDSLGRSAIPAAPQNALLLYSMYPSLPAKRVYDLTSRLPEVNALFYHDIWGPEIALLEAFPATASKAVGIRDLARICGADRIVAFGDNLNDIPMLKAADMAVAVENAVDEVKKCADIVIGPNTEDSVAKFILDNYN